MNQIRSWAQHMMAFYQDRALVDVKQLHYAIVGVTAILAAGFTLYVTSGLPYYPRGWLALLILFVGIIWFASPAWGRLAAIIVFILPIGSLINLGGAGLAGAGVLLLFLAILMNPYTFLVFAGLTAIALHPSFFPLLLIVPLALGFLGAARGALAAGLAALYVEVLMFLRPVSSIGVIAGGAAGKAFLFPRAHPVGSLLDFSWLQNQPVADNAGAKIATATLTPLGNNPAFIGQILVWAACAAIVGILLRSPSFQNVPRAMQSIAFGSVFLIIGQTVLAVALGKGTLDVGLLLTSAIISGILVFIASPLFMVLPNALDPNLPKLFDQATTPTYTPSSQQNAYSYSYQTGNTFPPAFDTVSAIPNSPSTATSYMTGIRASTGNWRKRRSVPDDVWDDLVGVQSLQREVQDSIESQFNPVVRQMLANIGIQPTRGILLYGPPGTGKSTLARIIAHEANAELIVASGAEFSQKGVSESEAMLRRLFDEARQNKPAVLCFDELEAFLTDATASSYLGYLDSLGDLSDILIIGTSSHPSRVAQSAFQPMRFDKLVYVTLPDQEMRLKVCQRFLKESTLGADVDLATLAAKTDLFSGADILRLCTEATQLARESSTNLTVPALTMHNFEQALAIVHPSTTADDLAEYISFAGATDPLAIAPEPQRVPADVTLTWDDVAGLPDVKAALVETVELPLTRPEVLKEFGVISHKGILLFGPAGCGKTYLARVAASSAKAHFLHIHSSDLARESEIRVRDYFHRARKNTPCVIFFDDLDIIAPIPSGQEAPSKVAARILTELDELDNLQGVMVMGASNAPEQIDPLFLRKGRFDRAIFIPPPDRETRIALLKRELSHRPTGESIDFDQLADALAGYTSADIAGACNTAAIQAALTVAKTGEPALITTGQLLAIIQRTPTSLGIEEQARYTRLSALFTQ